MTPGEKETTVNGFSVRKRKDSENMEEVRRKELVTVSPSIIPNSERQDASDLEEGE